jgi:hypothetical protein
MKMIEYIYNGMLLISIVLIYFAVKQYNHTKELISSGVKTTAKVIELIEISGDNGYTYKPVFEYTNRKNTKITFKSKVSSSPAPYKIGDIVNIIYSNDNDERKVVSFWGLYRWTIILLSIASPLLIIGGGYLLYIRR